MKKLTKIFATVLTLSLAMSTVVMPMTAEAAAGDKYVSYTFSNAADATTFGGVSQADAIAGKNALDKVAMTTASSHARDYSKTFTPTTGYVTYETQVYIPTSSTQTYRMCAFNQTPSGNARSTLQIAGGVVQYNIGNDNHWNTMTTPDVTGTGFDITKWNKLAMTWDFANKKVLFYVNGVYIGELEEPAMTTVASGDFGFGSTSAGIYIDNVRAYDGAYDPTNDIMPVAAGELSFLEDVMTVADAKTLALATQPEGKAAVHVYKDGLYGTEAADTDALVKGWYVVITSKSGDYYRADGIYRVSATLDCAGVTFADNTVTATVVNNAGVPVESMMMVLVEDGGKFVMSSAVQTNIEDTATFTITGVDSLSNAEVFFVESWDDLAPVLDSTFEVE